MNEPSEINFYGFITTGPYGPQDPASNVRRFACTNATVHEFGKMYLMQIKYETSHSARVQRFADLHRTLVIGRYGKVQRRYDQIENANGILTLCCEVYGQSVKERLMVKKSGRDRTDLALDVNLEALGRDVDDLLRQGFPIHNIDSDHVRQFGTIYKLTEVGVSYLFQDVMDHDSAIRRAKRDFAAFIWEILIGDYDPNVDRLPSMSDAMDGETPAHEYATLRSTLEMALNGSQPLFTDCQSIGHEVTRQLKQMNGAWLARNVNFKIMRVTDEAQQVSKELAEAKAASKEASEAAGDAKLGTDKLSRTLRVTRDLLIITVFLVVVLCLLIYSEINRTNDRVVRLEERLAETDSRILRETRDARTRFAIKQVTGLKHDGPTKHKLQVGPYPLGSTVYVASVGSSAILYAGEKIRDSVNLVRLLDDDAANRGAAAGELEVLCEGRIWDGDPAHKGSGSMDVLVIIIPPPSEGG